MDRIKALLVTDRRFLKGRDGFWYSEGPKGAETGERYLRWFDEVTVVGREGSDAGLSLDRLNRLDADDLSVVTLPNLSGVGAQLWNRQKARARLKELVADHDAVILRMPTQLGIEAHKLAKLAGRPAAVDLGGCSYDGLRAYGTLKARLFAPISMRRVQRAIARTHWVSYVTQEYLQARYPSARGARTIGCSNVDLPATDREILVARQERIQRKTRPLVFGTIGSLRGHLKGIQSAIAALASSSGALPDFQYRILGGGDPAPWQEKAGEHGIGNRVFFDGTLPAGEPVLEWLDQVDIYLQPSLREGVPRALIEAMSRGCPAIASNIAGVPELLASDALHEAGNADELGVLIENATSTEFMQQHSVRNWNRAQDFTRERLSALRDDFWGAFAEEAKRCTVGTGGLNNR